MSNIVPSGVRAGWILGALTLVPCAAAALAIWMLGEGAGQSVVCWSLILGVAAIAIGMGALRLWGGWKHGQAPGALLLTAAPGLLAAIAAALIPMVGFRWSIALLMGALAGQSLLDMNGETLPGVLQRIRPVVSAGVLVCLLVAFMGC